MKVAVVFAGSCALAGLILLGVALIVSYDLICADSHDPANQQYPAPFSHKPKDATAPPLTTLPLDLFKSAYPFVRGKVNNVETDILVDSGATSAVIDSELAESMNLKVRHTTVLWSNGGRMPATKLEGAKITLGHEVIVVPSLVKADMGWLAYRLGRMVPLVLGADLFEAYVVDLDYPHGRLALYRNGSFSYAGTGTTVPIRISARRPLIELRIEGGLSAWLMLDTGNSNAVVLAKDVWKTPNLRDDGRPTVQMQGGGGPGRDFRAMVGSLRSVTLAGYECRNVPTVFMSDSDEPTSRESECDGMIGAEVLTRFRVILDYARLQAHFEPWAEAAARIFRKDRIGLHGIFQGGQVVVTFVAAGSPASKAGVRIGDGIHTVDGRGLSWDAWEAERARWQIIPTGTVVVLGDGKSATRELVAADYY